MKKKFNEGSVFWLICLAVIFMFIIINAKTGILNRTWASQHPEDSRFIDFTKEEVYDMGYEEGYNEAYDKVRESSFEYGHEEGYREGYSDGYNDALADYGIEE